MTQMLRHSCLWLLLLSCVVHHARCQLPVSECSSYRRSTPESRVPALSPTFSDVVEASERLQLPQSSNTCLDDDLNTRYVEDRFYVEGDSLVFALPNAGARSDRNELRGTTFSASGSGTVKWEGRFRVPNLADSNHSPRFTVGQLFSETDNDDVAKVAFSDGRLIMTYNNGGADDEVELGTVNDGASVYIRMEYDKSTQELSVYRGSELIESDLDVSGKVGNDVYFKAGCYLQEPGECVVEFGLLKFAF